MAKYRLDLCKSGMEKIGGLGFEVSSIPKVVDTLSTLIFEGEYDTVDLVEIETKGNIIYRGTIGDFLTPYHPEEVWRHLENEKDMWG